MSDRGLHGFAVGVLSTGSTRDAQRRLQASGLAVMTSAPAPDAGRATTLPPTLRALVGGQLDGVLVLGQDASRSLVRTGLDLGMWDEVHAALVGRVVVVCTDAATARPLIEVAVPARWPDPHDDADAVVLLTRLLADGEHAFSIAGHTVQVRGAVVVVDGEPRELTPGPAAVLRLLAERPGRVVSKQELLQRVWRDGSTDTHAVEMTVARLRASLGDCAGLVRTVVKRGYQLAPT